MERCGGFLFIVAAPYITHSQPANNTVELLKKHKLGERLKKMKEWPFGE